MAETIEQLIIDIGVKDTASPALKKAREESFKLLNATDKLIGVFKKGDQTFAKVATTIEKIQDRQVRARAAVRALNSAMRQQNSITNKLSDQMNVARASFESLGATGQVLTGGFKALTGAAAAFWGGLAVAGVSSVKAFIASEESAQIASDRLSESFKNLQVDLGGLIAESTDLEDSLTRNAVRLDAFSVAVEENSDLIANLGKALVNTIPSIFGVVDAYGTLAGIMREVARLSDGLLGTAALAGSETAALTLTKLVEADSRKAVESAKGQLQFQKDLAAATKDRFEAEIAGEKKVAAERKRLVEEAIGGTLFSGGGGVKKKKGGRAKRPSKEQGPEGFTGSLDEIAGGIQSDALTARLEGINAISDALRAQVTDSLDVANATMLATRAQREADEATQKFNASLAQSAMLSDGVTNAFIGMASGIALSGDGIAAAGRNLLSSFGDIMIQVGTGALLMNKALLATFLGDPVTGIGAAAALIAGGLLIKGGLAAGAKSGGFAGASSSAGSGFAPTFNDFQRDQQKEERQVVQVFIGEQQVAGPVSNIVNDLARRGKLQELAGGSF